MPGRAGSPPALRPASPSTRVPDAWPARRMDDEPGRLVDDEQVVVLVGDPYLGRRRSVGLPEGAALDADLLPARQPVALGTRLAVDEHRPGGQQPFGGGPGADAGQRRDEAVEPLARGRSQERRAGSSPRGRRGARSAATSAPRRMATPITMKLSARLNAGQ